MNDLQKKRFSRRRPAGEHRLKSKGKNKRMQEQEIEKLTQN